MSILFTADLHITDNLRDEYRWGLFPWLAKQARKHKPELVILGGDLTDAKDKHSAVLTNRLVAELAPLRKETHVVFLRGNHDYVDEDNPFFGFLKRFKNMSVVLKPTIMSYEGGVILLLPNTRNYQKAWAGLTFSQANMIFCHQTFDGSVAENGQRMDGIPHTVFGQTPAFSGDIHKPQKVGQNIIHVGAPYHIRFGDEFKPRVLLIHSPYKTTDLHFPTVRKFLVQLDEQPLKKLAQQIERRDMREGDQLKVRVFLPRSEYSQWPEMKKQIAKLAQRSGLELWGSELRALANPEASQDRVQGASRAPGRANPGKALAAYGRKAGLSPALVEAGKMLLGAARQG